MPLSPQTYLEMENAIKLSHERSKVYKIDPEITKAPENTKLLSGELAERIHSQKDFYTIAVQEINTLYSLIKDTGFCVTLADKEGYILYTIGDKELEREFQKRNCTAGYRWTEMDMGTCAISVALVEKKPIYVPSEKMYASFSKNLNSAGAPVFDHNNSLLGAISLSSTANTPYTHSLALVCQTAQAIQKRLLEEKEYKELLLQNNYLTALLETSAKGIIAVDLNSCITKINQKAKQIFNLKDEHIGMPLNMATKISCDLMPLFLMQKSYLSEEIRIGNTIYFMDNVPILEKNECIGVIMRIIDKQELILQSMEFTNQKARFSFQSIIGKNRELLSALEIAKVAAKSNAPLLLCGEAGTGKKLLAEAIHGESDRNSMPFITINCNEIPYELLEKEIFGYQDKNHSRYQNSIHFGKLELANQGTIYFNEVQAIPYSLQIKILRAMQTNEIRRIGSTNLIPINVRYIFSSSINLATEVETNNFRHDLYTKISMLSVAIPSVRERKEDIPLLIDYFLAKFGKLSFDKHIPSKIKNMLINHKWEGNVYEIEKVIERAMHLAEGKSLRPEHFDSIEPKATIPTPTQQADTLNLEELEQNAIIQAIVRSQGNMSHAAKALGISRPTLYRKIERYAIRIDGISFT